MVVLNFESLPRLAISEGGLFQYCYNIIWLTAIMIVAKTVEFLMLMLQLGGSLNSTGRHDNTYRYSDLIEPQNAAITRLGGGLMEWGFL